MTEKVKHERALHAQTKHENSMLKDQIEYFKAQNSQLQDRIRFLEEEANRMVSLSLKQTKNNYLVFAHKS